MAHFAPDKLLVIPTSVPPHKAMAEASASAEERLEMLHILFDTLPGAEVSDMELVRGGVSYTADTLEELQKRRPGDELILLMGTDMICNFEIWRRYDWILSNFRIGAFTRAQDGAADILAAAAKYEKAFGARIELVDSCAVETSSTELREMLRERRGRELTGDGIYAYIIKNRLYSALPDYDWLREKAYAMLKPRRIPHVAGCEAEAVRLAERWGADVDTVRTAAILHDCTKRLELPEQLLLCEKYGIITDNAEMADTKLMHAATGAAAAYAEFGVSASVRDAIRWHTTGRAGMTLEEKVVYMADYIEPTRVFDGVERLRSLAYEDLDRALVLGLEMSIDDLRQGGIAPHPRTAEAAEYLRRNNAKNNG